jgi:cellobiose phosphorylase
MLHALLNDRLTPEQAKMHVSSLQQSLLGPDDAQCFARPPPYRGGPQPDCQCAESSTFFGRAIGLMSVHAYLRYAHAMARAGDVETFSRALRLAHPIALRVGVPPAALRQSNGCDSSADAALADRSTVIVARVYWFVYLRRPPRDHASHHD